MSVKLDRMGNAAKERRENNIFNVFAYLNTKSEFQPLLIREKVKASDKTILSYLKDIQKAQLTTKSYQHHLAKPLYMQGIKTGSPKQFKILQAEYDKWQKQSQKQIIHPEELDPFLKQYQFSSTTHQLETLYQRLELSILFFTTLTTEVKSK